MLMLGTATASAGIQHMCFEHVSHNRTVYDLERLHIRWPEWLACASASASVIVPDCAMYHRSLQVTQQENMTARTSTNSMAGVDDA
jgi:hypothetical protein